MENLEIDVYYRLEEDDEEHALYNFDATYTDWVDIQKEVSEKSGHENIFDVHIEYDSEKIESQEHYDMLREMSDNGLLKKLGYLAKELVNDYQIKPDQLLDAYAGDDAWIIMEEYIDGAYGNETLQEIVMLFNITQDAIEAALVELEIIKVENHFFKQYY